MTIEELKEKLINLSDGNIGATVFMIGLIQNKGPVVAMGIILHLEKLGIRGSKMWVLFKDLCDQDYDNVFALSVLCSDEELVGACGKEDRSGKAMVEKYLK